MNRPKRVLLWAGIAIVLLLAAQYLLPLNYFIPGITRFASAQLRAPVQIDSLRLFVLPRPHLAVRGIMVGEQPFLKVEQVLITPRLSTLFSSTRVIDEIALRDVVVGEALIAKASTWAGRSAGKEPVAVRVERIEVRDASVAFAALKMSGIDMDVELAQDGGLARAHLRASDRHFDATVLPHGRNYTVHIAAREWKLPAGAPLLMSELTASGILDPRQGLRFGTISGSLYDGFIAGTLNIGWAKDWTIDGSLAINNVEIHPVVALLTKDATISGRLSANPVIEMRAPTVAELIAALDIESDFRIEHGILYNIDLVHASKNSSKSGVGSRGQTRFDNFTGHLGIDSAGYHLSDVQLASGMLSADAEISISFQQELAGHIDVALKGTSGLLSTPLVLTGTVQSPMLYPSKAALAGAVAGTILLGPGLGTTAGMKAGRYTQKLFGKRVKKSRHKASGNARPGAAAKDDNPRGGTVPGGR